MLETQGVGMQGAGSPLTDWINSDVKKANTISIIMIIFAAWAGIEALSNVAGIEIPPETGMATNIDPDDTQRTNNGVIVGLGAVLGTVGIIIQMSIPRGAEEEEIVEEGPKFDEDLVKLTKWLCSRGTTTAQFFDWADVDNSGTIDMVELANALRQAEIANLPPWEIEELVKIMDINEDGRINLPELDIMLLKIQNTLGIDFIPYVEEETGNEEESEEVAAEEAVPEDETTEEDSTDEEAEADDESADMEQETEDDSEESEDDSTDEEAEADDESADAEEETEDDSEESEDEVAEEETEAEDDSTEEETEDETVEEEPPKKKKKF
ncbi:MAG: hypothetical protein CMB28_06580 [Euryarchaeota archaeon]|nr:hypothetical protein [Euryarchaeota archaeon]